MSNPNATPGADQADVTPPVRTSAKVLRSGAATLTVEPDGGASGSGSGAAPEGVAAAGAAVPTAAVPTTAVPTTAVPATAGGSDGAGTGAAPSSAPKAAKPKAAPRPARGPRRVRLSVSRIDPWSVMKLGFLLSVALGIMTVVAAAVAWKVLDSMGVFADLQGLIDDLGAMRQFGVILEYLKLKNIMSLATLVAIVNVALITALTTLGAFIYNVVAALVGGLHMTLTDD